MKDSGIMPYNNIRAFFIARNRLIADEQQSLENETFSDYLRLTFCRFELP